MTTDVERVGNCRSCGAEVVFRLMPSGKTPPYNYPPEPCEVCDGRGMITVSGRYRDETPKCTACYGEGKKWVTHFATCPQAKKWKGQARERSQ